MVQRADANKDD